MPVSYKYVRNPYVPTPTVLYACMRSSLLPQNTLQAVRKSLVCTETRLQALLAAIGECARMATANVCALLMLHSPSC